MTREHPSTARMTFYGVDHVVNLEAIRLQMVTVDREAIATSGDGRKPSRGIDAIAARCGVSHMTLRRLLKAHEVSLDSLHRILAGIGLAFEDAVQPSVITSLPPPRRADAELAAAS